MKRLLVLIGFGLSLVSCDKPNSSNSNESGSDKSPVGSKYEIRRKPADSVAELRTQLDAAQKRKSLSERQKALAEVAWNAIEIEPWIAREAFEKLFTESPERLRLIQHYAMRLAEADPVKAQEWAKTMETERETAVALGQIAIQIAEDDPHSAAKLIADSNLTANELDTVVVQVIQRWVGKSESDAASWVVLFSPGAARGAGIKVIVERWLPRDSVAAFDWLNSIQDPALRKEATAAMRNVISHQSPEIREAWLSNVRDEIRIEIMNDSLPNH
jgi:hypothetical protein